MTDILLQGRRDHAFLEDKLFLPGPALCHPQHAGFCALPCPAHASPLAGPVSAGHPCCTYPDSTWLHLLHAAFGLGQVAKACGRATKDTRCVKYHVCLVHELSRALPDGLGILLFDPFLAGPDKLVILVSCVTAQPVQNVAEDAVCTDLSKASEYLSKVQAVRSIAFWFMPRGGCLWLLLVSALRWLFVAVSGLGVWGSSSIKLKSALHMTIGSLIFYCCLLSL